MANYIETYKSKMDWANTFVRTGDFPLDRSSIFSSLADANLYAAGGADSRGLSATSYPGQVITVFEDDVVTAYVINPDGSLKELASAASTGNVASDLAALATRVSANEDAIAAINNASTGILAQAKAYADGLDTAMDARMDTVEGKVSTLIGDDATKSVRTIAAEEIADLVNGADASYDTLKEIADWIADHPADAAEYSSKIAALEAKVGTPATEDDDATGLMKATAENAVAIAAETTARTNADTALQNAIDAINAADTGILAQAKSYTDTREAAITTAYQSYADTAESDAKTYADGIVNTEKSARETADSNLQAAIDTINNVDSGILATAKSYTDTREAAITTAYQGYADTAESDAKNYADTQDLALKNELLGDADTANSILGVKAAIAAEVTARTDADTALSTRISNLEGSGTGSIASQIDDKINALDVADAAEGGKFVTAVSETDGKISVSRAALVASDIPELAQSKITGLVDALADKATVQSLTDNVTALKGTAADTYASASIEGAKKYADKVVEDKIATLDVTDNAESGKFVTAVSESDGKISVSRAALVASDIPELAQSKITGLVDALASMADSGDLDDLADRVTTAETAITTLNGADIVTGSVAKAVKDAKDALLGAANNPAAETIRGVKSRLDAFLNDATVSGEAIDTLLEIQNYISTDQTGSATMLQNIADNANAIEILNGEDTVEGSVAKAVKDAKTALLGTENTAGATIYGAKKDAADALAAANTVASDLTTETTARTNADTALGDRIAVFEGDANKVGSVANQVKVAKDAAATDATTKADAALASALAADEKVVLKAVTFASVTGNTEAGFSVPMNPDAGYALVTGSLAKVIVNGAVYVVSAAAVAAVSVGFALESDDDIFVEFREVAAA